MLLINGYLPIWKMKLKLNVKGMHCASCGILIKDSLGEAGAKNIDVSHEKGMVSLEIDDSLEEEKIKKIISNEGYEVVE